MEAHPHMSLTDSSAIKSNEVPPERLIRIEELTGVIGLCRSSIYKKLAEDPPTFPRPIKLGVRAVAWTSSSVQQWIAERITQTVGE